MTLDEARLILGDLIADDGVTLDSRGGFPLHLDWWPDRGSAYIESNELTPDMLEAIAVWMRAHEVGRTKASRSGENGENK